MKKIALILTVSGLLCVATAGQAMAGHGTRHSGPPNVQLAKHHRVHHRHHGHHGHHKHYGHHGHHRRHWHHGHHCRPPVVIQPYYVPYPYYYVPWPYGRSHGMVNYYGRHFSVGIGF